GLRDGNGGEGLRITMKKIAHSELMTIRSSPNDAVKSIVMQMIVMGQGKVRNTVDIISFLLVRRAVPAQSLREHATGFPFCELWRPDSASNSVASPWLRSLPRDRRSTGGWRSGRWLPVD